MPTRLHGNILGLGNLIPVVDATAYVAPGSYLVGDVLVGANSTIWFNVVIRGDGEQVRIGDRTNVQDGAVLHIDPGYPCIVGDDVTIGHGAIVHGAMIECGATIGMGAIVLSGARIGRGAVVAAGALVTEGTKIDAGMLAMGTPAKPVRAVSDEEASRFAGGASHYVENGKRFTHELVRVDGE